MLLDLLLGMGEWVSHSFGSGFGYLVDGAIGPDGSVYVLQFGGKLYRIAYVGSGVAVDGAFVPPKSVLHQNYPSPFKAETAVLYDLSAAANVSIDVYDAHGRLVSVLADEWRPAGSYEVSFDATGLPSVVYFFRLTAGGIVQTRRLAVVR